MTGLDTTINSQPKNDAVPRARRLVDEALEELSAALKHGKSEAMIRYLTMLARFHRYSFSNVLLIISQRPDATRVAGFGTWKGLSRFVKKGEKGILIIAPVMVRKKAECLDKPDEDEETEVVVHFRAVYVFDVSQTDGEPLPEPQQVSGNPSAYLDQLKTLIADRGIAIDYADLPGTADGVSRGGRISIRDGLSPAQKFSVLVHELAHELLHFGEDRPMSKTIRETEAEAVAFVVSRAVCLETGTAASDYIQLYDGKVETLAASFDRIQRAAAEIIDGLGEAE